MQMNENKEQLSSKLPLFILLHLHFLLPLLHSFDSFLFTILLPLSLSLSPLHSFFFALILASDLFSEREARVS